jgi:hypothetical protein
MKCLLGLGSGEVKALDLTRFWGGRITRRTRRRR